MEHRIAARDTDVSDATPRVLAEQLTYDLGSQEFSVIDASSPLEEVVRACLAILGEDGGP
jgi:predicted kinase